VFKPSAKLNSENEGFYRDVRNYSCINGAIGQGDKFNIICQASGQWSQSSFTCIIQQPLTMEKTTLSEQSTTP